ncbi:hypothetical protein E4O65_12380, partial [Neisseria meningitidis]|nr:hypothetical protein [Neisseria meningitidis]
MDFFNFFEQGYFKKLAVENGLNTEYFIFQFIVCNLLVFSLLFNEFYKNYAVLIVLIVIVSILFGLILKINLI